ncbi:hypothetical protein I3842_06G057300 [Carya illinoinensis]|uniref:RNase H type-1 domain-containing protein n=1 Tax=Carya illinoinensis TaxID=32201 RepID=A0A922EPZ0_CARIL|nr:hypothetical protein I3842_06G057300 [Carya illinoinensis]
MEGKWQCNYLRVPLHVGWITIKLFEPLLLKLQKKLASWKSNILSFGGKIILLKHVLSSMPIHILSVMNLLKGVFKAIKSIFSSFIWNSTDDKRKRKWVSWKNIFLLVEEGGLGIRSLADVQMSLSMKFAWKLLKGKLVWVKFFQKKYVVGKHLAALSPMPQNSCILVRNGICNFWFDNWLGDGAIANSEDVSGDENLLVADTLNNSGWDVTKLHMLVSEKMVKKIIASPIQISGGVDVHIWQPNLDGTFSTKFAWHLIRATGAVCLWKKWLWHKLLQSVIVVFYHNKNPLIIFFVVVSWLLWFGGIFRYFGASESSQAGCCHGILLIIITWALWRARCENRMEGKKTDWKGMVRWIKLMLTDMELNCPIAPVVKKSMKYKLNVYGSSLRNPGLASGRGVIRDHDGQVSNNVDEGRALFDGLKLAQQLGIRDILVESDSEVIVRWIQAGKCNLWYFWDFWDDIQRLFVDLQCSIRHIFKKANMVADYLAKEGASN